METGLEDGAIEKSTHPFFKPTAGNGRACATCHVPENAMGLSADHARSVYVATRGKDPLFAAVDGTDCPSLIDSSDTFKSPSDHSNPHSLLLDHGLFRIRIPWPPPARSRGSFANSINTVIPEFAIEVVSDPSHCNLDPVYGINGKQRSISVFRRPLMAAFGKFRAETTYQTGRPFDFVTLEEAPIDPATNKVLHGNLLYDGRQPTLEAQAIAAAHDHHEMATDLTAQDVIRIVDFESRMHVAQTFDKEAGSLTANGAQGGARNAAAHRPGVFIPGDLIGGGSRVAIEFESWRNDPLPARRSIARGAELFNHKTFDLDNVAGVTDSFAVGYSSFRATCSNCHDTRGTFAETVAMTWRDIGVSGTHQAALVAPYLPVFRITCVRGKTHPFLGSIIMTHDPGRALITGRCADVGKVITPPLRGLSARAPYFSNGSAATIDDVINFYDKRFDMKLTPQEKTDLSNFLKAI